MAFFQRACWEERNYLHSFLSSLTPIILIVLFLLTSQYAYAVGSMVPEQQLLNFTWNTSDVNANHYRLEITETDMMNESADPFVYNAYTDQNHYQIELEEGFSYSIRVQAVSTFGICSEFSEITTFTSKDVALLPTEVLSDESPAVFSLSQNHPNPFNPSTTITYSIADDKQVKLVVYNVSGQKVTELENGMAEAGTHSVVWDASGMPSGIYFYSIITDKFKKSKKMLLVK